MGVASYREDDFERWTESTGRFPVRVHLPDAFFCPFCAAAFSTARERLAHIDIAHRGEAPELFIHGRRVGLKDVFREPIRSDQVEVTHFTSQNVEVDGRVVPVANLGEMLATLKDAIVQVHIENTFDPRALPIERTFEIKIAVADRTELAAIDNEFVRYFGSGQVTDDLLLEFRTRLPAVGPAREYGLGLAAYAQGVWGRDHPDDVVAPSAAPDACYSEVCAVLKHSSRPLARLARSIAKFVRNDLRGWDSSSGWLRLDRVVNALLAQASSYRLVLPPPKTGRSGCPTDVGVDTVISLSEEFAAWSSWDNASADRHLVSPLVKRLDRPDELKVRALLSGVAARFAEYSDAARIAEPLLGDLVFGTWAAEMQEQAKNERGGTQDG